MLKYMYRLGQEIEYSNGILADVVAVRSDGYFVIYQEGDGYAACYFAEEDCSEDEPEIWSFLNEEDPFVPSLSEAQSRWPRTC